MTPSMVRAQDPSLIARFAASTSIWTFSSIRMVRPPRLVGRDPIDPIPVNRSLASESRAWAAPGALKHHALAAVHALAGLEAGDALPPVVASQTTDASPEFAWTRPAS